MDKKRVNLKPNYHVEALTWNQFFQFERTWFGSTTKYIPKMVGYWRSFWLADHEDTVFRVTLWKKKIQDNGMDHRHTLKDRYKATLPCPSMTLCIYDECMHACMHMNEFTRTRGPKVMVLKSVVSVLRTNFLLILYSSFTASHHSSNDFS